MNHPDSSTLLSGPAREPLRREIETRMLGPCDVALLAGAPPDLAGEAADARLARTILEDPRRYVAAARAGGTVIGIASAVRVRATGGDAVVVRGVAVARGHRRRGVGRQLLVTLLDHARASGCREARVEAAAEDVALRGLCASAGGVERAEPVVRVAFALR